MDTDGSISVSKAKAKSKVQLMANYQSNSLRLVQEVRLLAASLGISGRITASKTPAGEPCWMLAFSNVDIHKWGAEYMKHPAKLKAVKSAQPDESAPAYTRKDLVPITKDIAGALCKSMHTPKSKKDWPEGQASVYAVLSKGKKDGYVTRTAALRALKYIVEENFVEPDGWEDWVTIIMATDVTWDMVVAYERTGIPETGYDLSVPVYENFMNVDGIILSNTMQIHVPVSKQAIDDAREKMLPSKNLFSVSDFDVHMLPKQEFLHGLYLATARKSKRPATVFASREDAVRAYKNGEIGLGDKIVIR
jgi:hypothetical protein